MSADQTPPQDTGSRKGSGPFAALEFFKFVLITVLFGLNLAGYTYIDTVYNRFGLSLHQFGIDYTKAPEFTIFFLHQPYVVLLSIVVILAFSAAAAWARYSFENFGFYLLFGILLIVLVYFAGYAGVLAGNAYAESIIRGVGGKHAYCVLKRESGFDKEITDDFRKVTSEGRVRMITQTEQMIYLYIVTPPGSAEQQQLAEHRHGEHIAIPLDAISFCRVSGAAGR